jgi:hypothetical protein
MKILLTELWLLLTVLWLLIALVWLQMAAAILSSDDCFSRTCPSVAPPVV